MTRLITHSLSFMDPPEHSHLKSLIAKTLNKKIIQKRQVLIRQAVKEILSPHLVIGEIDIIRDLATPLPTRVIADLLGIPEKDHTHLRDMSSLFFHVFSPIQSSEVLTGIEHSIDEFTCYLLQQIRHRRQNPGDDLLTDLIQSREGGEQLTDDELVATCILIFSNGVESLTFLFGNAILALLKHREQLELLQQKPQLIGSAVEEFLRYDSPSQAIGRVTLEPITFNGITIPTETPVYLLIGSANRDPEQFKNPERFDITRKNNRHLTFGSGIHTCIGAGLARAELQIVFMELLGRIKNISPVTRELNWRDHVFHRGLESLTIRFETT